MIQHVSFVTSQQKENRCCLLVCVSEKLLSRHFCFQASEVNGNSKNQEILCHHTRSYKWFVIISLHLLWLLMFLFGMFIPWNSHLFDSWRYFALPPRGSKNYHAVARPGEVMREAEKTLNAVIARLCTTHVDCLTLPVYWILHDFVWFQCFSRSFVKGYLMFHGILHHMNQRVSCPVRTFQ